MGPRMDTNERQLVFKEEVFRVVGCAVEVLNALRHGLQEKTHENALVVEFELQGIPFRQQPRFDVICKGIRVVVDTRTIDRITDLERGQIPDYLKIT